MKAMTPKQQYNAYTGYVLDEAAWEDAKKDLLALNKIKSEDNPTYLIPHPIMLRLIESEAKQVKKKVVCNVEILETSSYNIHHFICPTCHGLIAKLLSKFDKPARLRGNMAKNYCSDCGQHLDWEVEK